ncbi:hypothetical protein FHU36_003747 [Nonomuraea muscovyensis]|uniref:Uncharacterized protein n=1 Tax=Nonomuraea muscovyensis TaxID=1124761 RepID=A0A7X0C2A4_9ACTN|nr:DUF6578 domain-containing protein [Nonomuraea muscovyensis]MBB6347202.1 hypothetical protein [Nonomuraea muscovyensis]
MRWNIWVSDWQMQCCGDPFRIGSTVSWTLCPADRDWLTRVLGEETAATIDWSEDHHSDPSADQLRVEAQVTHISAVHAHLERLPDENAYHPVRGVLSPQTSADGWNPDQGDLQFIGYLVTLAVDQ